MKKYSQERKDMILQLVATGKPVAEISREYGIAEQTIYKWKKSNTPVTGSSLTPAQIKQMEKEMTRLRQENEILKKGNGYIHEVNLHSKILFIENESNEYPTRMLLRVMEVAPSTYYKELKHTPSQRELENERIDKAILSIYTDSKKRYGTWKIHHQLIEQGFDLSIKRVQKRMRLLGIHSITVNKYHPTKASKERVEERTNLLNQDFSTTSINQKWAADTTYISTAKDGWTYLASVIDLYSKKIIGYTYAKQMTTEIVMNALESAIQNQQPTDGLIIQTDLGSQYTSSDFEEALRTNKITHSYSRKGTPYDNSCIESFHAALKKEEVYQTTYHSYEEAKLELFQYIEGWYNRKRIHGAIGYLTPQQAEDQARQHAQ
ncbi:IS3 family transposase [Enterococcus faecalis]|uniref:IS3 family transposase n=1 Tax=Enterococcus faecalis TaxID=1351 RepID=UPI003A4DCC9D